ncbi:MAG: beta-ketoacyl synthase [Gammaproteobacteria bacterium]
MQLPVIVGFGGISPAGRSSQYRAAQRMSYGLLNAAERQQVLASLAALMGREAHEEQAILDGTLVREIASERIDTNNLPSYHAIPNDALEGIEIKGLNQNLDLPGWHKQAGATGTLFTPGPDAQALRINRPETLPCKSAGQLPSGFDATHHYPARMHPMALAMTVFGMSDALGNMGLDWDQIAKQVPPDRIAVISGSALAQVDEFGVAGYTVPRLLGKKISSRVLALSLGGMSADFIHAYILGSYGITGNYMGACATWLYNLSQATQLISSGKVDVAIVGTAESQVNPGVIEAFNASSAMATDEKMLALQKRLGESTEQVNYRHTCRPFAENTGMILGESAQFAVLMSDSFAMQCGADILASILSCHIHADGYKYSISSPGDGNYLTVSKALAECCAIVGEQKVRQHSSILAHGTGTPQNRVTESHILNSCATAFNIENWPVMGIKSMLGHSMGSASGDQAMAALGIANRGLFPGIPSANSPASDVHCDQLDIHFEAARRDTDQTGLVFMNAKGFGGNNATGAMLGQKDTLALLEQRHGKRPIKNWQQAAEKARQESLEHDQRAQKGEFNVRYEHSKERVTEGVRGDIRIDYQNKSLSIKGTDKKVSLDFSNPFAKTEPKQ